MPGQDIPKTVTATPDGIPTVTVKIEHNTTPVPHTDPVPENGKTPTGKVINGAHKSDLNQTITRTINVTTPDGQTKTITQDAHIYRDATYDDVTGEVTYGKWSTATWDSFTPAEIDGYIPSQAEVAQETVKNGMTDQTVNITYNPIPGPKDGQQVVHYVDPDGNVVTTQTLTGKQDEDVPFTPQVPENWTPVNGVPSTIKITGGTTTILIKHKTAEVSDSRTVTRTIVEELPSGTKTATQTTTISRTGIKDLVTGETSWNGWTTSQWNEFTPEVPTGYTPSQSVVAQMPVNGGTQDTTVTITYTKIPEPQDGEQIISYQDKDGHIIHTQTVTGKQGADVSFTPEVPANWQPVNGVPTKVKIDGSTTVILIEPQTKPVEDQKTITRTIIEHLPNGKDQTTKQSVTLKMTGTKNLVTGEITDAKWTSGKFDEFTPEAVPGYTPSQAKVASEAVTSATKDQTVNITYTAKDQSINVIYRDGNQFIKQVPLTGKTGETVDVNLDVPANYHVVNTPAKTYTFKADGNQDIIVELAHNTEKVTDSKTITRTINVTSPDGQVTTTKQTVTLTRTGIKDLVTGTTTWDGWSTGSWDEFDVSAILGYTPSQAKVDSETVTSDTKDQTINISYTPNSINTTNPTNPMNPANESNHANGTG